MFADAVLRRFSFLLGFPIKYNIRTNRCAPAKILMTKFIRIPALASLFYGACACAASTFAAST
ncbi:MAG: hypothetical protein WBF21_14685, partial [Steroidobacteraceae bacterium]